VILLAFLILKQIVSFNLSAVCFTIDHKNLRQHALVPILSVPWVHYNRFLKIIFTVY